MVSDRPRTSSGSPEGGEYSASVNSAASDSVLDGVASQSVVAAIAFEERDWVPSGPVPHSERLTISGPYRAAIPATIAGAGVTLPGDVDALVAEATAEIARFDTEVGDSLGGYASLLLRSESAASSRIERLTASAKAIALAELGDPSRQNAAIIVANTNAMRAAIATNGPISAGTILGTHRHLLGHAHPEWAGKWRTQQVWIGGSDHGPHGALFVPPHHDRIPGCIDDLVVFANRTDIATLTQVAVAHAQFETIHPFPDGNGRTGRALAHTLLRSRRLTRSSIVPVSAGLLTDTGAYFDALTAYRHGDPAPIVAQFAEAAFRAIGNSRILAGDIAHARTEWDAKIIARAGSAPWKLADLLTRHPVVDSEIVQREVGVVASNANAAIEALVVAGVLSKVSGNFRFKKWAAPDVLAALDAFAERAGRRDRPGA